MFLCFTSLEIKQGHTYDLSLHYAWFSLSSQRYERKYQPQNETVRRQWLNNKSINCYTEQTTTARGLYSLQIEALDASTLQRIDAWHAAHSSCQEWTWQPCPRWGRCCWRGRQCAPTGSPGDPAQTHGLAPVHTMLLPILFVYSLDTTVLIDYWTTDSKYKLITFQCYHVCHKVCITAGFANWMNDIQQYSSTHVSPSQGAVACAV